MTNQNPPVKTIKGRRQLLFQLFIALGFLALVWFSFGQNVLAPRKQDLPEQLGKLTLVSSVEGAEALTQINKLHGTNIELVSASIGQYARGNERVTVWVARAESSDIARELLGRMVEGISKGNASFSNLKQLSIAQGYHNHEVFQVDGPGGKHFFYLSKKSDTRVVWLATEVTDSLAILEEALAAF